MFQARIICRTTRRMVNPQWQRGLAEAPRAPMNHPKPVSPHIGIYKDFGRPFVKVFLMAMCTYQGFYWLWLKMELDEKKREKAAEISLLQDEVKKLTTEPSI